MSAWETAGQSDNWFTPKYVFDAMGVTFDLDVTGAFWTHVPCRRAILDDSLSRAWAGFVWLNPPFGGRNGLMPWLEKFVAHGDGVALTPDRTSAPWFQWAAGRVDRILFLSPKVKFERPDEGEGPVGNSPGTGTALMAIGSNGMGALFNARHLGWLVRTAV